jgi:hypothetical protein
MIMPTDSCLSIIIPWCNRPELGQTLQHHRDLFIDHGAEVVIVNCGGTLCHPLARQLAALALPELMWVEAGSAGFNKSLALNLGVSVARGKSLFFLDCDVLLQEDFLGEALALRNSTCFVTVDRVFESDPPAGAASSCLAEMVYSIELVTTDNRRVKVETNRTRFADGSRSGPGLILLAREHFLHVDGMNSQLEGWGWEDNDLVARLQLMLGLAERRAGSATHLSHGDQLRSVNGRSPMETANANIARSLARYAQGNFQGTYRADVAAWQARERASALNLEQNSILVLQG